MPRNITIRAVRRIPRLVEQCQAEGETMADTTRLKITDIRVVTLKIVEEHGSL